MIPASVTPSVNANVSSAGVLFPLMEPTSAELAEFDQLLGDFSQLPSIMALSTPALTLSKVSSSPTPSEVTPPITPEGLLSTIEQGALLALQAPQDVVALRINKVSGDEQTMQGAGQGFGMTNTNTKLAASADISTISTISNASIIQHPSPMDSAVPLMDTQGTLQQPLLEVSTTPLDKTQDRVMSIMGASGQVGEPTVTTESSLKVGSLTESLMQTENELSNKPQTQNVRLTAAPEVSSRILNASNLSAIPAQDSASVMTDHEFNTSLVSNQHSLLFEQDNGVLATAVTAGSRNYVLTEAASPSRQVNSMLPTGVSTVTMDAKLAITDPEFSADTYNKVVSEVPLFSGQSSTVASVNEVEQSSPIVRSMTVSNVPLLIPTKSQAPEAKVVSLSQHVTAPITTRENPIVAAITEATELPASMQLFSDNKAVVFASTPAIAAVSSGVIQAASSSVEITSASQMANPLASAIMANSAAGTHGSASQDHQQKSTTDDLWMQALSEAQSVSDAEPSAEEFSLMLANPLSNSTFSAILAAPLNLRQPQWAQDVAQRVQVMVNQSMNELEVRLDPLGLGPMKIGLKLDEQQKAHVTLSAQHGLTREMLENALPRLKELLAQEGVELASATINSGENQTRNGQSGTQSSPKPASDLAEDAANATVSMTVSPSSEHLVDQFA